MNCLKENHRGQCCCTCKHQITVACHPANKTFAKGRISDVLGYVCVVPELSKPDDRRAILFEDQHGLCEMWTRK